MASRNATIEQLKEEINRLKGRISELEQDKSLPSFNFQKSNRTDQELQESEKKYKDLFEKSKDAILILQNGKFVDCNKATINMLRFKNKNEFLNTHPSVLSPEKQQDGKLSVVKADEMIAIALKNGSHRFEWDHKKANGEVFPVEVLLTVIENTTNNQILHTVWRDITERKLSENALRASEEKLSAVFENSTILLYAHNTEHVLTYISPQVEDILGYTSDEALVKWTSLASDNPINEIGIKITEKAIKTGKPQAPYELELLHKNGKKIWVEVREAPVVKKGKTVSIVGSLTDITDRKNAEQKLKQSEKRFKRLFNDLGDAVFVTSIAENTMGDILEVNPAAVRQTGYSREELLSMNIIRDISIQGSGEIDTADWNEKLKAGHSVTAIEKKRRKDGTEYWTEVLVTPIDLSGEQASLSINHDITSRKIAEDELKASEEHFRALFENASIGFYRTTPEGEIVLANPALVHMLGFQSFEELANRDLKKESFDTVVPRNKILDLIDSQGFLKGYESVWITNKEETIYIRENAKAFYDKQGKVKYYEGTIEDISEEKRAELLLKESEEKYRTLIENIQDGVFIIGDGKISYVNEAFASIIGYTKEEVLCLNFKKIIAPEDWRKVLCSYIKSMKGEAKDTNIEFRALHKDGITQVFVTMTIDRVYYDNKPVAFGTVKDISTTKKMQEQLAIREKYYKALFDLSPSGILVMDANGTILDINKSFCKHNGYTPEELRNKNISLLVEKENQKDIAIHIEQIMNGETLHIEVTNISKDGSLRNLELYDSQVTLPDGKLGIISIANDITERTRAAQIQSVIYKTSYAVNISDNLDELISIIREGLGTLIDTTNFFVAMYEEETDTIVLPFIVDEKDSYTSFPAGKSLTAHVIRTKQALFATKEVVAQLEKDGVIEAVGSNSEIWLGVPMFIRGKVTGAIVVQSYDNENAYTRKDLEILEFVSQAISISISRKKAEQDLLKALEKATESDRLKSVFLATMSHELRTPLNAIIGFSEIIERETHLDDILEYNKTINSSGMHLLNIVEDIFDITLIETGEINIDKKDHKLISVLNSVHDIIKVEQRKTDKKHIEIKRITPPNSEDFILFTDAVRLKQILINLLKNALKFTTEGYVHYGYSIETIKGKTLLKFFVQDSGIGIPKDKQDLIFEMFRQVEDSHTRIYGGTGIGLSISRKLTNLLGGNLWVESDPESYKGKGGAGTNFYFTIPFDAPAQPKLIEPNSFKEQVKFDKKNVLIVEDDEASFEFLNIVLNLYGINTIWAKNGREAIKICSERYDLELVLMDINMPEMNGYDATIEIKKMRPSLPVIAQTAYAISGDRRRALDVGCDDYISKPIDKTILLEKLGKYFKHL